MKKITPSFEVTQAMQESDVATLFTDYDHICVPVEDYAELVKAKVSLGVLENMYMAFENYDYEKVLRAFFGAKKGKDDA